MTHTTLNFEDVSVGDKLPPIGGLKNETFTMVPLSISHEPLRPQPPLPGAARQLVP